MKCPPGNCSPPGGVCCEYKPYPPQKYWYEDGATQSRAKREYCEFLLQTCNVEVSAKDIDTRPIFPIPLKVDRTKYIERKGLPKGTKHWMFRMMMRDRCGDTCLMRVRFGPGEYRQVEAIAKQRCQLIATDFRCAIEWIELEG